jgi:hypothetical protein
MAAIAAGRRITNVHTVHIAENFRTDWTAKGYPVEQ